VESPNGFVIPDLPYFRDGLDFLPPNGEISCDRDYLVSLLTCKRRDYRMAST
jgi:hypothetical protein